MEAVRTFLLLALFIGGTAAFGYRGVGIRLLIGGHGGSECSMYNPSYEPCDAVIARVLAFNCDKYIGPLSDSMFNQFAYGSQSVYFAVSYTGGTDRLYRIRSLCDVYNKCNRCGENGICELIDSKSVCTCRGGYEGKFCSMASGGGQMVIAIVLAGICAVLLLVGLVVCCCWNRRRAPVKVIRHTLPSAVMHPSPGTVTVNSMQAFNQMRWNQYPAASPVPTFSHNPFPASCRVPRSTVRITELPDDYTPPIPKEESAPTVYTTIPEYNTNYEQLPNRVHAPANVYEGGPRIIIRTA